MVVAGLFLSAAVLAVLMSGGRVVAGEPKKKVPRFEDFPVTKEFQGKPARVDLASHPYARLFRTSLKQGAAAGPNFAGHYALVTWGCGNECGELLVVDVRTGKVYGVLQASGKSVSGSAAHLKTEILEYSRGADFQLTSKLLIVDPPCPKDYNPCVSSARTSEPVRYYVMEKQGLRFIDEASCRLVTDGQIYHQECGNNE